MTFTVDAIADCGISGGAATVPPEWKGNQMLNSVTLEVTFAEYLRIKMALNAAAYEARAEALKGARAGNAAMQEHYEGDYAAAAALIEKLTGQAHA